MRLAFMGTPAFSLATLTALHQDARHEICLVITQPDKPTGRGRKVQAPPVKQLAAQYGLEVLQPARLKDNPEILAALKGLDLDAVVVVAYGKIIPPPLLEVARYGYINIHASLLPRYRGAAPINHALLDGCQQTGVSIMQIDEGLDSGPVFLEESLEILADDDALSLAARLATLGAHRLLEVLPRIESADIAPTPQDHARVTYAPLLRKEDGLIDWSLGPDRIRNRIRGLVPWPCAYTFLEGRTLKILRAACRVEDHSLEPGLLLREGRLKIACAGGFILPEVLQLEGKNALDSRAFANGLKHDRLKLGGV